MWLDFVVEGSHFSHSIMESFLAIIFGDYFCSFQALEIAASEPWGVHYGF